jgi:peptidoglycan/LPS O-acetylase OafA/YrhL
MTEVEAHVRRWPSVAAAVIGMLGVAFLGLLSMLANIHEDSAYSPPAHMVNLAGALIMLAAIIIMGGSLRAGRIVALVGLAVGLVGAGVNFYLATQVA